MEYAVDHAEEVLDVFLVRETSHVCGVQNGSVGWKPEVTLSKHVSSKRSNNFRVQNVAKERCGHSWGITTWGK